MDRPSIMMLQETKCTTEKFKHVGSKIWKGWQDYVVDVKGAYDSFTLF